jgi:hypothetical protein
MKFFKLNLPSRKTVGIKGVKLIRIKISGHETTHYRVVWAYGADGAKLTSLLIFKLNKCLA